MATVYSDVYSNASVTNNISYRTKVDYTVTDYDATVVIAGTVTLQAKGTFSGSVSSTYKKIVGKLAHSSLAGGLITTTMVETDKVTRGTTSYSNWTNLKSATFSETWNKYTHAHTEYLFPSFVFYDTGDVSRGTWGKPSTGFSVTIGAKTSYAVTYDANGGTNAPNAQTKWHDTTLKLSTAKPTRDNASFVKWSGSDGNDYQPGDNYTGNAALTLTAVWISVPQITSLVAVRCKLSGGTYTDDDEGTYARVSCAWSIDPTIDAQASATVTGTIAPQGGTASAITIESGGSGTSGTAIAHPSNLDPDTQYSVTITVTNGTQATSRTVIITRAFFIMDFKAGGGGIGIGRAAPASGLEVGYDATFDADVLMREDLTVTGDASAATVTVTGGLTVTGAQIVKSWAGVIQMFAGSTPPAGWLLCDGSAVSRTTYATLFAAIGTTWGAGDGSTTFNLPDLRGRTTVGVDPNGSSDSYAESSNMLLTDTARITQEQYLTYKLKLSGRSLAANTRYTLQLFDVHISHAGKTETTIGLGIYWGNGGNQLAIVYASPDNDGETSLKSYTADGTTYAYCKHLTITLDTTGKTQGENELWIYNSPGDVSARRLVEIGRWMLNAKADGALPWEPRRFFHRYGAYDLGMSGGIDHPDIQTVHMPSHTHNKGTLAITASGGHTHTVKGYGKDLGSGTKGYRFGSGGSETIGIGMNSPTHTHPNANFSGNTGSEGGNNSFDVRASYAVVNYIIHTGKVS